MLWFWLNIPLAAVFLAAWCGTPLWLVLTRPDQGPVPAAGHTARPAGPVPVTDRAGHRAAPAALVRTGR